MCACAALLDLSPGTLDISLPRPLSLLLRVVLSHSSADGCSGSFQGPGMGRSHAVCQVGVCILGYEALGSGDKEVGEHPEVPAEVWG